MTGRVQVVKPARPEVRSVSLQVDPPEDGEPVVNVELAFTTPGTASRKISEVSIGASAAAELARRLLAAAPEHAAAPPSERRRFLRR